ncbi:MULTISPECIES: hypothetical protein [unclassified Ensifer]|uniref:hypothetical protein n=1 Tax=unclassified Ensifer TaxID=2633371 RepID=UPI000813737A|nr:MULTISPECIES: hypothetical protein [unclassified Ensifer]OCP17443.1 hypothetical protein BC361_08270 [Ensifer sp. LC54]OCP28651.1 hypothetical protein BC363_02085 [Ensifer sp. LC384]
MTAQSQARSVVEQEGRYSEAPMKGATTIFQGALVVMDAGLAVPGRTALNLVTIGIAEATVVNSGADGVRKALARRGTFKFFNHGADAVTSAEIGKDCFIADDQTVAKTNGTNTRSIAGKVVGVESDGVFVRVGY